MLTLKQMKDRVCREFVRARLKYLGRTTRVRRALDLIVMATVVTLLGLAGVWTFGLPRFAQEVVVQTLDIEQQQTWIDLSADELSFDKKCALEGEAGRFDSILLERRNHRKNAGRILRLIAPDMTRRSWYCSDRGQKSVMVTHL